MKRLTLVVLLTAMVVAGTVSQALAQALTDAQQALQKAKAAYDTGHFSEARDLAQKASETDPKNPDVFLLLGKAHYQLGELDEAMTAWKQTLALAPKESFAKKMLEVLQSRRKDVDSRIRYIESLVAERLDARRFCRMPHPAGRQASPSAMPNGPPSSPSRPNWPFAATSPPRPARSSPTCWPSIPSRPTRSRRN